MSGVWVLMLVLLSGCGDRNPVLRDADGEPVDRVSAYRVRADFNAEANANTGWAAPANSPAAVTADLPFRLRYEVVSPAEPSGARRFYLQFRRGTGGWEPVVAADHPYPEAVTPAVSVVSADTLEGIIPAADLLEGAEAPHRGGAVLSLEAGTPRYDGNSESIEWEWPLIIRRFSEGPTLVEDGETFTFRLVDAGGAPLPGVEGPVLTVEVPAGHLGGTFVETPGRIGPWEAANGDLYFIMEPAETDNVFMMVKSTDRGRTWQEVDGAHRPPVADLEGVASIQSGDTIHILHQVTEAVYYHSFRTADHPGNPDRWLARGELVAEPGDPPTQVAAITARPDGSLVAAYGGSRKIRIKVRSADGAWGEEIVIDPEAKAVLSGPQLVTGAGGVVHLCYTDADGNAWARTHHPDGALSPRERLAEGLGTTEDERIPLLPLVYLPESDTVCAIFRRADGLLFERRRNAAGIWSAPVRVSPRAVVTNAVDSDQVGADAVGYAGAVHVLFIDEATRDLFHVRSGAPGSWSEPEPEVVDIDGNWIRGNILHHGPGGPVYGYVYDAGSRGGSGMNRFGAIELAPGENF